jgi:hypothetical protein
LGGRCRCRIPGDTPVALGCQECHL